MSDWMIKDFENFYKDSENILYKISKSYVRNRETARDIVVESLTEVYRRWDKVKNMENPTGYAVRICINRSKKHLMKKKLNEFIPIHSKDDGMEIEYAVDQKSPDLIFFSKEEDRIIEEMLYELKEIERNIIILKDIEKKKFNEIADLLGLKLPTIKSHYRRGKLKLSRKLENQIENRSGGLENETQML